MAAKPKCLIKRPDHFKDIYIIHIQQQCDCSNYDLRTLPLLLQTLLAPKGCILVDVAFIHLNHLHILTIFNFIGL